MTVEEWAALDEDEDGELVDGQLEEEERPTILHEVLVKILLALLDAWARRRGGLALGSEVKIAVGPRRGRKPDVSVFVPPHLPGLGDSLVRVPPCIVVEVLSPRPRDAHRDRIDKMPDYARAKVRSYWIVDPVLRTLEVFELDERRRRYSVVAVGRSGRIPVPGLPAVRIDFSALWAHVDQLAAGPVAPRARRRAR